METDTTKPDGWSELGDLLHTIRVLFGDALKAAEALSPKLARDASRWLRGAEAFARVLLLTLAQTVTIAPVVRRMVRRHKPRARTVRGGGLFAFAHRARRWRRHRPRRPMSPEEEQRWYFFGGKEHAAEERARRKAERWAHGTAATPASPAAPASSRQFDVESVGGRMPALPGKTAQPPSKVTLIARYNALARVFNAPDAAARRLARRLAATPTLARRVIASAHPRDRWRTGYDDTIKRLARAVMAPAHDSS